MKLYRPLFLLFMIVFSSCATETVTDENKNIDWFATSDSIQSVFYSTYLGEDGVYVSDNTGNKSFQYWPNAHVLNVLVDGYTRTGDVSYLPKMKSLLNGIKLKNGNTYSNIFNDDMLWLGNASVRAYLATGDENYKKVAEFLWNDVLTSWSAIYGGGITWKKDTPNGKNAVSNGPAIILAMRLYNLNKNIEYLEWAKSIYEGQKANLVDPNTGLVWDNISTINGQIITNKDWIFTYNVGTWIGANILLYKETKEQDYLEEALKSTNSMIFSSTLKTLGLMKDDGQGDGGLFKGILVRYFTELILLQDINLSDKEAFLSFFELNAYTFYMEGLKRPEMLAGPNWKYKPRGTVDLTTQLSGMMLIEAAAKLDKQGILK